MARTSSDGGWSCQENGVYERGEGDVMLHPLGRTLGAQGTAFNLTTLPPGSELAQPHCHATTSPGQAAESRLASG